MIYSTKRGFPLAGQHSFMEHLRQGGTVREIDDYLARIEKSLKPRSLERDEVDVRDLATVLRRELAQPGLRQLEKRVHTAMRDRETALDQLDKVADDFAALTNRVVQGINDAIDLLEDPRPRTMFEVQLEKLSRGTRSRRGTLSNMHRSREHVIGLAEVTAAEQDPDRRRERYLSFHYAVGQLVADLLASLDTLRLRLASPFPSEPVGGDRFGEVIRGRYADFERALDCAQDAWSKVNRESVARTYERLISRLEDAERRSTEMDGMPAELMNWLYRRNDVNLPPGRPNAAVRSSQ